jgi:hypothetical protein
MVGSQMNNISSQPKSPRPYVGDVSPTNYNHISKQDDKACGDAEAPVNREISELQGQINKLKDVLQEVYNHIEQVASPSTPTDKNCKEACVPYKVVSPVAERIQATRSVIEEMISHAREIFSRLEV